MQRKQRTREPSAVYPRKRSRMMIHQMVSSRFTSEVYPRRVASPGDPGFVTMVAFGMFRSRTHASACAAGSLWSFSATTISSGRHVWLRKLSRDLGYARTARPHNWPPPLDQERGTATASPGHVPHRSQRANRSLITTNQSMKPCLTPLTLLTPATRPWLSWPTSTTFMPAFNARASTCCSISQFS